MTADLGPLQNLIGSWMGPGFNAVWRAESRGSDRFLELNSTVETLVVAPISGPIMNRGLQEDVAMSGVHYLQQVSDTNLPSPNGIHLETGVWLNVPSTTTPTVPASVVRMASVPHGTTVLAQGEVTSAQGPPTIPAASLNPVSTAPGSAPAAFPEQDTQSPATFRSTDPGIQQPLVDDPNSLLRSALAGQQVAQTTTLHVTTGEVPIPGGGCVSTAFLAGVPAGFNPNAQTVSVDATFWIEQVQQPPSTFLQLQYSQTVVLVFNNFQWPHVSVGTLRLQP